MITKKQWNKFCRRIFDLNTKLGYGKVLIHGNKVAGVYLLFNPPFIKTISPYKEPIFFKYGESFDNSTSLDKLYDAVSVSASLNELKSLGLYHHE